MGKYIRYLYLDSTLIPNKQGIDEVTYNPQCNKHKSTKISVICEIL